MAYDNPMQYHYQASQSQHFNQGAPQYNEAPSYPLKPIPQTSTSSAPTYAPIPTGTASDPNSATAARTDAKNKRRIRILKALQRVLATILSLATFIPLALTMVKFFETRNQYMTVDGASRTAWASGTTTWYTYLYFSVATVSLLLNAAILVSYCCGGVRSANATARVEGWWAMLQRVGEVCVWIASVAIYRYGKEPNSQRKFTDLWGWTCSPAADQIQSQITNINFSTYCTVQTTSFYTGVLNVLASLLTISIYVYAIVRRRSKSKLQKAEGGMEPLRY